MEGLACVRGLCSTAPRLGELCSDDSRCDTGLVCIFDGSTGMQSCQPPPRVGERCDSGICEASAFCDWGTMLCAARLDVGGDCQFDNSRCIEGLVCLGDDRGSITRCAPLPRLGERCTSGVCFEAACVEAPAVGQCEPTLCTQLGGGDVEPPRPEPF